MTTRYVIQTRRGRAVVSAGDGMFTGAWESYSFRNTGLPASKLRRSGTFQTVVAARVNTSIISGHQCKMYEILLYRHRGARRSRARGDALHLAFGSERPEGSEHPRGRRPSLASQH